MNTLQILVFIEFLESVPTFMEIRFVKRWTQDEGFEFQLLFPGIYT